MRACWQLGGLLLLAELAAGCAARQCQPEPSPLSAPVLLDCRETVRTALVPDVALVAGRESLPATEPVPRYCNLTEREAQCLAATSAPYARLLEQEAEAVAAQHGRHGTGGGQATQDVLLLQATHERNRAASASLQALLRLAEAEAGGANLRRRLDEV